jgi:hypothetical protein
MRNLLTPLALIFVVAVGVLTVALALALQGHTEACLKVLSHFALIALGLAAGATLERLFQRKGGA